MRDERRQQASDDGDGMSLGAFLGHKTSGGSGEYLRAWRKDGEIKIWLHTKAGFHALWNHNWPRVSETKDKQTKETMLRVFGSRFVCHDPETVTRKARFKDDDGRREHAPVLCPMCFMLDWISAEVAAGRLDWTAPVFKFEGDDPEHNVVLHAGGMVGLYKSDLTSEQKKQLGRAGISLKTAWRENVQVRCQYLFQVVDDSDPSAGVVKALEAGDLGDKLKDALRKEIKKRGDRGNPGINPYPLLWSYDENEPQFGKKYDVTALDEERPSKEILGHITGPKLDLSSDTRPGDCLHLRTEMEAHALIPMPFDEFFEEAERRGLMKAQTSGKKAAPAPARSNVTPTPATSRTRNDDGEPARGGNVADEDEDEEDGDPVGGSGEDDANFCDFCEEEIGSDDLACGKCGATYLDDGEHIRIDGLLCLDCKTVVPIADSRAPDEHGYICPKCATVHKYEARKREGDKDKIYWTVLKRHPKQEEPAQKPATGRRGGRTATPKVEPKPAPKSEPEPRGIGGHMSDEADDDQLPF